MQLHQAPWRKTRKRMPDQISIDFFVICKGSWVFHWIFYEICVFYKGYPFGISSDSYDFQILQKGHPLQSIDFSILYKVAPSPPGFLRFYTISFASTSGILGSSLYFCRFQTVLQGVSPPTPWGISLHVAGCPYVCIYIYIYIYIYIQALLVTRLVLGFACHYAMANLRCAGTCANACMCKVAFLLLVIRIATWGSPHFEIYVQLHRCA